MNVIQNCDTIVFVMIIHKELKVFRESEDKYILRQFIKNNNVIQLMPFIIQGDDIVGNKGSDEVIKH